MTTYKELLQQRADLEAQIQSARKAELSDAVAKVRQLVAEYDLTAADVFGKGKSSTVSTSLNKVAPKYRDPVTGATWTGRGKPPLWIAGRDRAAFEIAPTSAAV